MFVSEGKYLFIKLALPVSLWLVELSLSVDLNEL